MPTRVDVPGLIIAVVSAVAIGLSVAGIGYLLGAPAGLLGTLTSGVVSGCVLLIYTRRQRRRLPDAERPPAPPAQ